MVLKLRLQTVFVPGLFPRVLLYSIYFFSYLIGSIVYYPQVLEHLILYALTLL